MATDYVALYRSLLAQASASEREAGLPRRQRVLEREPNGQGPHGDPAPRFENGGLL
jgi:hypothetical protein